VIEKIILFFLIGEDENFRGGILAMNVYVYAAFSYLFTAVIALFMIGVVVLLNKLMGGNAEADTEGSDE
jgi:hypothetical protein